MKAVIVAICLLQISIGNTEDTNNNEEGTKENTKTEEKSTENENEKSGFSDYIKSDDILYKILYKPRDCINPLTLNDSVTMEMEWGTTTAHQTITVETSVALRIESEGITFKLDQKGLQGMCLGEKRNLVIPEYKIRSLTKDKVKRIGLQTVLTVELVEVNGLKWEKLQDGLQMVILEKVDARRCGRIVVYGDTLAVGYEGSLEDGTVFDSSESRGQPFGPFLQGHHQIIRGYEIALEGRCLGERFKMIVPPHLAYGDRGVGDLIPPEATLYFDVRLVQLNDDHWTNETEIKEVYSWETLKEGDVPCEAIAKDQDDLYIHYLAIGSDGTEFGTLAEENGSPYGPFRLDGPELVKVPGLGPGIQGMCLGEERLVILPPRLGWEDQYDTIEVQVVLTQINDLKAVEKEKEVKKEQHEEL